MNKKEILQRAINEGFKKTSTDGVLTYAKECSPLTFDVFGNSYQEVNSGKQLYNYTDLKSSYSFLTYDDEGWYTATIDRTSETSGNYYNFTAKNSSLLQTDTTYAIITEIKSVESTGEIIFASVDRWGQFQTAISYRQPEIGTYVGTSTTKSSFDGADGMLSSFVYLGAGAKVTMTFRLSVIADTSVTPETFVYESYTGGIPSPNPDYPQEIEVVKGTIEIEQRGKNLLDLKDKIYSIEHGINYVRNTDGSISYNGTATASYSNITNNIPLELEAGTYSFSTNDENTNVAIRFSNDSSVVATYICTKGVPITFTLSSAVTKYYLYLSGLTSSTSYNGKLYLQLEQGDTATTYEPYHEPQTYQINLGDNTLAKVGDTKDKLVIDDKGNVSIEKNIGDAIITNNSLFTNNTHDTTNGTFQFLTTIDNTKKPYEAISNYAKSWDWSWKTTGCFISFQGQFGLLVKDTESGFSSDMELSEALTLLETLLSKQALTYYYQLATPQTINLTPTTPIVLYNGTNIFSISSIGEPTNNILYNSSVK